MDESAATTGFVYVRAGMREVDLTPRLHEIRFPCSSCARCGSLSRSSSYSFIRNTAALRVRGVSRFQHNINAGVTDAVRRAGPVLQPLRRDHEASKREVHAVVGKVPEFMRYTRRRPASSKHLGTGRFLSTKSDAKQIVTCGRSRASRTGESRAALVADPGGRRTAREPAGIQSQESASRPPAFFESVLRSMLKVPNSL